MTHEPSHEPAHIAQARYLGHDAALTAATWVEMTEAEAESILTDVDPAVLDRFCEPNLSGEFADDPTPASLARDVGANDGDIAFYGIDLLDAIATAWEEGRDEAWSRALDAHALRVLGRVAEACEIEHVLETAADRLRRAAT
jgi:hypothetical protein